jgi:putative multicomponent Na+:H+ antiporter subunit B
MNNITFYSLLPFEISLPFLGILLIRSNSPTKALIYRSFLGSIAALVYSLVGAPDVALTEVLVGTLLSTLIYIVSIRGCFSLVLLVKTNDKIDSLIYNNFKKAINELHIHLVVKKVDDIVLDENGKILWDKANILSGSPHAALIDNDLYVESKILRDELSKTSSFQNANFTIIEK